MKDPVAIAISWMLTLAGGCLVAPAVVALACGEYRGIPLFLIPAAIFEEAFLSFIGIGIAVPIASWGTLANDGMIQMGMYPYLMLYPALAISFTMFALNFIGDGLRDALDSRLKK